MTPTDAPEGHTQSSSTKFIKFHMAHRNSLKMWKTWPYFKKKKKSPSTTVCTWQPQRERTRWGAGSQCMVLVLRISSSVQFLLSGILFKVTYRSLYVVPMTYASSFSKNLRHPVLSTRVSVIQSTAGFQYILSINNRKKMDLLIIKTFAVKVNRKKNPFF